MRNCDVEPNSAVQLFLFHPCILAKYPVSRHQVCNKAAKPTNLIALLTKPGEGQCLII